ncbi:lipase family protein [Endozoicomonas sp.]|uniref:lipase family protein n=1 Tax=Endozoicomonas sp. TaxID=1892382 RepID=UPI00383B459E
MFKHNVWLLIRPISVSPPPGQRTLYALILLLLLSITLTLTEPAVAETDPVDYVWLAYAGAAAAYLPVDDEDNGPRYLQDGKIQKNWSSIRINVPGRCAHGLEKAGELCYPPCKDGYNGVGPVCWQPCKSGYTNDGVFCRRDRTYAKKSYGRGAGKPLGCRPNEERNGLLCYKKCKNGYKGRGPVCWQQCPKGYKNHGATCYRNFFHFFGKKTYGRGAGRTLTSKCDSGLEKDGLLCYSQCKSGYNGVGPVCWEQCKGGFTDTGAVCQDKVHIYTKDNYGRGAGKPIIITSYEQVYDTDACSTPGWTGRSFTKLQEYIVLRNESKKITLFTFRGTKPTSLLTWLQDFDFTPHSVTLNGKKLWLHSGFQRRFNAIADDIKTELLATPDDHTVIVTGHSLGAAIAAIAAPYFYGWGRAPDAVITFAGPVVGNGDFRDMYESTIGCDATLRITVDEDPIPKGLKVYGYTHVCDAASYTYNNSNVLKVHDLYLSYFDAVTSIYGPQASASNTACAAPE